MDVVQSCQKVNSANDVNNNLSENELVNCSLPKLTTFQYYNLTLEKLRELNFYDLKLMKRSLSSILLMPLPHKKELFKAIHETLTEYAEDRSIMSLSRFIPLLKNSEFLRELLIANFADKSEELKKLILILSQFDLENELSNFLYAIKKFNLLKNESVENIEKLMHCHNVAEIGIAKTFLSRCPDIDKFYLIDLLEFLQNEDGDTKQGLMQELLKISSSDFPLDYKVVVSDLITLAPLERENLFNKLKNSEQIFSKISAQYQYIKCGEPKELLKRLSDNAKKVICDLGVKIIFENSELFARKPYLLNRFEQKKLYNLLLQNHQLLFGSGGSFHLKVIDGPQTLKDFFTCLENNLAFNQNILSAENREKLFSALSLLENKSTELAQDILVKKTHTDRTYISDFLSDVEAIINADIFCNSSKQKIKSFFGFNTSSNGELIGYVHPCKEKILQNIRALKEKNPGSIFNTSEIVLNKIEKRVAQFLEVDNFIDSKNKDTTSSAFRVLLETFPELCSCFEKDLCASGISFGEHLINSFEKLRVNTQFQALEADDKDILFLATLFSDISINSEESAFDASMLIKRLALPSKTEEKIFELIKTVDCYSKLNAEVDSLSPEDILAYKKCGFSLRYDNLLELSKILYSVTKEDEIDSEKFSKIYDKLTEFRDSFLAQKNILPQTKFLPASKIDKSSPAVKIEAGNVIVDLGNAYAFEALTGKLALNNSSLEKLRFLCHGLAFDESLFVLQQLTQPSSSALLSSSYVIEDVNLGLGLFRKYGVVFLVDDDNVGAAYFKDFGSGFFKSTDSLIEDNFANEANFISDYFKQTLFKNESKSEANHKYIELCRRLQAVGYENINLISQELFADPLKIQQAVDALNLMFLGGKRAYNRQYNEILVSRPKIQAVFCFDYSSVENELRNFAKEKDLPIVIIPRRDDIAENKGITECFDSAASIDSAEAQFQLACYYDSGQNEDLEKAFHYLQLAATQGHIQAQHDLAYAYFLGRGCEIDYFEAFKIFEKFASTWGGGSQFNFAEMYRYGLGTEQDFSEAFKWYQKSAEQGYVESQFQLAILFEKGLGTDRNSQEAFKWFKKAADQGNVEAQYIVGFYYYRGWNMKVDFSKAYDYFEKAALQGHPEAEVMLAKLFFSFKAGKFNLPYVLSWRGKVFLRRYSMWIDKIIHDIRSFNPLDYF